MNIFDEYKTKRNGLSQYGKDQLREMVRLIGQQAKVKMSLPRGKTLALPIKASGIEGTLFFEYMQEHMTVLLQQAMTYVEVFAETGAKRHLNLITFKSGEIRDFWAALDCFYHSHHVRGLDVKDKITLEKVLYSEIKPCLDSYLNALNLKVNDRITRGKANSVPVLTEVA